ncbi:MAG: pyruvate kinase [Thermofilaceae archaeon]
MGGYFVKIVASLGPSSTDEDLVLRMAESGADAFRTNFAHGDPEVWIRRLRAVRAAEEKLGKPLAMIGDLKGPSVRVGEMAEPLRLKQGDRVLIAPSGERRELPVIPVPFASLFESVEVGDEVLIDDGRVRLKVVDRRGDALECVSQTDALVEQGKNVSLRGKDIDAPLINERDLLALKVAAAEGFDFIGVSHVRDASDVEEVKRILRSYGSDAWVIAKIETLSALRNLDSIIEVSDVVLVARGDLGIRLNLEEVPYYQKLIVEKCLKAGKPVIVATQFLASMIDGDSPTRAEAVDVSVAVEQGVDAIMLTNETSVGKRPLETVRWLARLIRFAEEKMVDSKLNELSTKARMRALCEEDCFVRGVVELAEGMGAKLVTYSVKGRMAVKVASQRPTIPVYVGTPNARVARKLSLLWALHPVLVTSQDYDEGLRETLSRCLNAGFAKTGETLVLAYGLRELEQKIIVKRLAAKCG